MVLPFRNTFSAGTILISFICLFLVVGGMYLVNSRREASLLIPESQPAAASSVAQPLQAEERPGHDTARHKASVAQRLQEQVIPSLFALWERAKSAAAVQPDEPLVREGLEDAAIVSEMQQVPLEQ